MLCIVLAPGVTRWVKASQGLVAWAEICSATVRVDAGTSEAGPSTGSPASSMALGDHCPWCVAGGGWAPAEVHVEPLPAAHTTRPPLFYQAPTPLFAWASAQPRAPPNLI